MRVVNLDDCIISHIMNVTALSHRLINDQLRCIADHKVLLIDTKQLSLIVTVIRIQKQCKITADILFIEVNSISFNNTFIYSIKIK